MVEDPHLGRGSGAAAGVAAPDGGGNLDGEDVLEGSRDHRLPRTRRDDPTIVDERPIDVQEYRLAPHTDTLYTGYVMVQLYAVVAYRTFWN